MSFRAFVSRPTVATSVSPDAAALSIAVTLAALSACGTTASGSGQPDTSPVVVVGSDARAPTGSATPAPAMPGVNVPAIKVDTVGYPTNWRKVAVLNVEPTDVTVRDTTGQVILKLGADRIDSRGVDTASKDPVWQVDFSELTTAGTYVVHTGEATSDPFVVADAPYRTALVAAQKHFYFQRTRTALALPYADWEGTAFVRATASHAHDEVGWDLEHHPEKKQRFQMVGGWHDAGNFDMYVPSTAPTAHALLMAYEWDPTRFADRDLNIPESGNNVPDLLDEARWGLDWILSMQDPSGAFRHREAVMKWSPEGPADQDDTERWVAGVSTAATAKAVAALAVAARVYRAFDQAYAKRCEVAARQAWAFLLANPTRIKADGKGSAQPLWDDEPEFTEIGAKFIAAAEMWRSFADQDALAMAQSLIETKETTPTELLRGAWANLSRWALGSLAMHEPTPAPLREHAGAKLVAAAELLREQIERIDGYRCASKPEDYYWASNSQLLEKAHVLLMASRVRPDQTWMVEAARDQWHWILGRNPNGYSMVTRVGKGPDRIYHMEWGNHEPPPPGYLIGGPNHANMAFLAPDAPAKALLWDNPEPLSSGLPAHSLWHWRQSDLWDGGFVARDQWTDGWWAVTEPDIYYNANLVLVAVAMQ